MKFSGASVHACVCGVGCVCARVHAGVGVSGGFVVLGGWAMDGAHESGEASEYSSFRALQNLTFRLSKKHVHSKWLAVLMEALTVAQAVAIGAALVSDSLDARAAYHVDNYSIPEQLSKVLGIVIILPTFGPDVNDALMILSGMYVPLGCRERWPSSSPTRRSLLTPERPRADGWQSSLCFQCSSFAVREGMAPSAATRQSSAPTWWSCSSPGPFCTSP